MAEYSRCACVSERVREGEIKRWTQMSKFNYPNSNLSDADLWLAFPSFSLCFISTMSFLPYSFPFFPLSLFHSFTLSLSHVRSLSLSVLSLSNFSVSILILNGSVFYVYVKPRYSMCLSGKDCIRHLTRGCDEWSSILIFFRSIKIKLNFGKLRLGMKSFFAVFTVT